MSEPSNKEPSKKDEGSVPMSEVVRFVRQLSHDLRNHLNAAELQSAFLNELAQDAEVKSELQRLRSMLSSMGSNLQHLTNSLAQITPTKMPYKASELLEDLRSKIAAQFPEQSAAVTWKVNVADAALQIDPQLLQEAMQELFANAFRHERGEGQIELTAEVAASEFTFTLREPKPIFTVPTESWGREPFRKVGHGHYGLGLARVRSIIEAHDGQLSARYDLPSSSLVTTVVLPVEASS